MIPLPLPNPHKTLCIVDGFGLALNVSGLLEATEHE